MTCVECVGRTQRTLVPQINPNPSCVTAFQVINQFHHRSTIDRKIKSIDFRQGSILVKSIKNNAYTQHAHLLLLCLHGILRCSSGFLSSRVLQFVPLDSSHPSWNNTRSRVIMQDPLPYAYALL